MTSTKAQKACTASPTATCEGCSDPGVAHYCSKECASDPNGRDDRFLAVGCCINLDAPCGIMRLIEKCRCDPNLAQCGGVTSPPPPSSPPPSSPGGDGDGDVDEDVGDGDEDERRMQESDPFVTLGSMTFTVEQYNCYRNYVCSAAEAPSGQYADYPICILVDGTNTRCTNRRLFEEEVARPALAPEAGVPVAAADGCADAAAEVVASLIGAGAPTCAELREGGYCGVKMVKEHCAATCGACAQHERRALQTGSSRGQNNKNCQSCR